jgi:hypothetical protein
MTEFADSLFFIKDSGELAFLVFDNLRIPVGG